MKKNIIKAIHFFIVIVGVFFVAWGCAKIFYILNFKCLWHEVFGVYCAGCGVTRMILAIANLDFYQAFRYNIAFFTLLPICFIYMVYFLWCKIFRITLKYKISLKIIFFVVGVLLVFMVLRNMPEFYFLAPMEV